MNADLNDLRLLRTAAVLEAAFERFSLRVCETIVQDPQARAALRALSEPECGHLDRITRIMRRLLARMGPAQHAELARAALTSVRDTERIAAEFYDRVRREVVDPEAAALFAELAREERGHVDAVDSALEHLRTTAERTPMDEHPFMPELQFLHDLETFQAKG